MMKSSLIRSNLIFILLVLFIPNLVSAESKTFIKEYTYQASEADSKISSRTIALEQVKRLLLEELGTYIESHTEVVNFQLTKDQISALTAGIVQTQIIKEKWDGERYWMQAKIEADPDEVSKSIDQLRKNREKIKDNQRKIKSKDELLMKIEKLKKEISAVKGLRKNQLKKEYNKTINKVRALEWMEKGNYFIGIDEDNKALDAFNKAIQLDTQNPEAYLCRATYYMNLGNYRLALKDCETAIRFNANGDVSSGPHMLKGLIYLYMKQFKKALNELERAIEIDPKKNQIYIFRGDVYSNLGNYKQALVDYEKAIELNNKDALSYEGRGLAYSNLGDYQSAIINFDKAIELRPGVGRYYYLRGDTYYKLADYEKAYTDYKVSARLGNKEAQNYLKSLGIEW